MFKVEAHLKEIATRQLTQRAVRKECGPRRPEFVSASRSILIESTIMPNEKNLGMTIYDRRRK